MGNEADKQANILVTGAGGFVGPHLKAALTARFPSRPVLWTSRTKSLHPILGEVFALDVLDEAAVSAAIQKYSPSHVVHLAGISAPSAASRDPRLAWNIHLHGTLNVARAILQHSSTCCLLFIGSGLVYGESANHTCALEETDLLSPTDEYGVTKAAADLAVGALVHQGLSCVRLRPFNHTGIGRSDSFVVPSLISQVARIEAGLQQPVIRVGNLEAERDFLDVRDVVNAYALVAQCSSKIRSGSIFNVASGRSLKIGDILQKVLALSQARVAIETDSSTFRTHDLPRLVGKAARINEVLGWAPVHDFDDTIAEILNRYRMNLGL